MSEVTTAEVDAKKAKSEAFSEATTTLRENHRDEYNDLVQRAMRKRGVVWAPRLTPAQKAADEAKRLLAQHPEIAADLRALLG
jgi:hypothetical protein